ncbi:DUF5333 domain-containing protein [Roseivivax sediminis]|uniref:DUF5333 domain-containing protein n=1 Tax=Roseivivax sediminis TaxID=936889 RepID=A0A1I1VFX9_9RHOB|nr:DUF5333 domain-containing protein [Roseivivax sediminis]SFD81907.1 hypothetical protein SAMN04515678_103180 [Roseivivax sediminis]
MRTIVAPLIAPLVALSLAAGAVPAATQGQTPLRDVAEIDDSLLMVAIADDLRKTCDDIDARLIRAYSYLQKLKGMARDRGYSDDEIEDYVTSKAEKKRMEARGKAFLAARGVDRSDKGAYCTFGKQEIARGSQIGVLLRAR